MATSIEYYKLNSPVKVNRTAVPFTETVEHVGILRDESSNLVHVMSRLRAHQRALHSLRIEKLFAQPILLKGLGSFPTIHLTCPFLFQALFEFNPTQASPG